MMADNHPIRREELPPGWGPSELRDDRFAYRHSRPPITLVASATSAARSLPGLGLCRCWKLHYRYSLGDRTIRETIGHVSSRRAAVEGLLECMHCVHRTVGDVEDPIEVQRVLDRVSLSCFLPESAEATSPNDP
ncbi:hypothetical protein EA473_12935 [Natrarchaeobius chitinivorans]|uniref:Uncharacterized protein n=2 Tax=Natrarchaeobius chitinivorans TaxID=1679083 RepID=A0A3N6MBV8_NATCH|nr:hypothetical protein [Natrarchaeobius chitinivorans]RQG93980.1 hypothetical protein EA473_12935 [Natrarchaeobius chitinivorans]